MQERNDLGLQLIERNEEVCVFYEKLNVQESIIREANLKFNAREEELKLLNVEVIIIIVISWDFGINYTNNTEIIARGEYHS